MTGDEYIVKSQDINVRLNHVRESIEGYVKSGHKQVSGTAMESLLARQQAIVEEFLDLEQLFWNH